MVYTDKKVHELRSICQIRGLATSGTKAMLIKRLEQQPQQLEVKQENEMQIDVASLHVSESRTSHETLSGIKYEYETHDELQAMAMEEIPASEELSLPQQSLEQDMSSNVDMSIEYPQSIDPVEQQIDQPPTESSSPIVTHADMSTVEVSSSSLEQNDHDHQSKPFDSSDKTYSTHDFQYEMIDRELLTRLISERKYGTQNLKTLSKGIMMNQGQTNGVPYNYDLLLDIVQKSEIYKGGEIPDCLRHDYDPTFGTSYFGEPECVRNIGILVEELFSFS